jgi:hypothetical protein
MPNTPGKMSTLRANIVNVKALPQRPYSTYYDVVSETFLFPCYLKWLNLLLETVGTVD